MNKPDSEEICKLEREDSVILLFLLFLKTFLINKF